MDLFIWRDTSTECLHPLIPRLLFVPIPDFLSGKGEENIPDRVLNRVRTYVR